MTMMIGDLTELATWVLGFGETVQVVEPPEFVERVTNELEEALANYGKISKRNSKVLLAETAEPS